MIELRKDYILDRWSYIAMDRESRLKQFNEKKEAQKDSSCFFCPGNERMTPPEKGRIGNDDGWKIRWFPNKFPITTDNTSPNVDFSNKYFVKGGAFGYHEVIAESPDHTKQLWDLNEEDLVGLFRVYESRIRDLSTKENVKYVQLFKNSGAEAGTSLIHTHTQIVTTNILPRALYEKLSAVKNHVSCPYCDIIKTEEQGERHIFSNNDFVAFTPFAPRFNHEAWIFPKAHLRSLSDMTDQMYKNLAKTFVKILTKLRSARSPYNFYLHYSPKDEDLHFHFEITPRLNKWAGFELATDSFVITVSPENAAQFYKK